MHFSATFSRYLARQFLQGIAFTILIMMGLVFIVDLIELLRRTSGKEDVGFLICMEMAFFHLPTMVQKLLPFAALFGGIWAFSRLTRSNELVVARAAGVSVWQFLAPAMLISLVIGGVSITLFNPFSAVMISRYEQLEARHLEGQSSLLAVSDTGLWLRQADSRGQSVIHALRLSARGMELKDVIVFLYDGQDTFAGRIDAKEAKLTPGNWILKDALLTKPDEAARRVKEYLLPTSLTLNEIQNSFAPPETLSFWSLPRFIATLEAAGFSAVRHRIHWHSTLATPLLLCAMVLLAATFSLRQVRRGNAGILIASGVTTALVFYVVSDLVLAFGLAGNLPVVLAAWTPSGVTLLLGLAFLFHLEDG